MNNPLLLLLLLLATTMLVQAKEHPKILSGMSVSKEQADALGFQITNSPPLYQGDKLLFQFGDKRILLEIRDGSYSDHADSIDESAVFSWMILKPDATITESKKLLHHIPLKRSRESSYPAPAPDTFDDLTFSWHVESAGKRVILSLPSGINYTLIRADKAPD